ncbi:RICIN domain-containing protein [Streptomyces poonensis]|uniref:Ricin B lectin domain-containing protein n=1 Tax=Streptomyces poonensis TaxID=68255 RepID=A0A918PDF1_9ACTN|nr:RICIN domain-containing protein [Streptomyces poonensis]GGZ00809.1 hypothetical protein GCM10010365_19540 [Streptomyces poonensis]GLJ90432.1 hypothetical protein GCM10017589_30350 [Streptomyces poonensis]
MADQYGTDDNARRSGRATRSGGPARQDVRRAVVLGGTVEGPGAAWAGRGAAEAAAEPPAGAAPEPRQEPAPSAQADTGSSESSEPSESHESSSGTADPAAVPARSAAPAAEEPTAPEEPATPGARRAVDTSGEARTETSAAATTGTAGTTVAAASGGTAGGRTAEGHGRNGPSKPLLAAAALVGVVLVGVPILLMGGGDDDRDGDRTGLAGDKADSVLQDPVGKDVPPGTFVSGSPSPSSSPSPSPAKKKSPDATDTGKQPEAAGSAPSPSKSGARTGTKKETGSEKRSGTETTTRTADSSIRNVLIKNVKTGMCVDVPGYGNGKADGAVNQYPCNAGGDDNQMWSLEMRYRDVSPKGTDLYQIRNVKDGLCLDLPNYGPVSATTKVSEFPCNGTTADNQLWWLDRRPDGSSWVRNFSSNGLCLDVSAEGGVRADSRLTLFHCSDSDDHRWRFSG